MGKNALAIMLISMMMVPHDNNRGHNASLSRPPESATKYMAEQPVASDEKNAPGKDTPQITKRHPATSWDMP